jgi:hypothetical protein
MNADPTDTRFPHLDLGDLIAEANGQTIGDRSREHLASCGHCQLEVNRWSLVADGVRGLAAAAPEAAPPARPRRTGRRVLARPARRAMLVAGSAAAALVLLVGVGAVTGLVHVHVNVHESSTETALTAVTGCARLEQAAGTLEQVNGSSVVIKTASGRPVTVTTTATTRLIASGALLSDITDGSPVLVTGPTSNGTIAADLVTVGGRPSLRALPGLVVVRGTVADASTTGFTVLTSAGTRVPVTISGGTDVAVFHASLSQLQAGGSTTAIGYAGPHGTLSALAVLQSPSWPAGAHGTVTIRVKDCSPASINHEIMALAGG